MEVAEWPNQDLKKNITTYDVEITSHHTVYFRQLGTYKQRVRERERERERKKERDRQTDRQSRLHKIHKNRDTQNTHIKQREGRAEANTDKHRIKWWEILFNKTRHIQTPPCVSSHLCSSSITTTQGLIFVKTSRPHYSLRP